MFELERVGGPHDGQRSTEPILAAIHLAGGVYTPTARVIADADGVERRALVWAPAAGGHRNPPVCREACSRGCPAYSAPA